MRKEYILAAGKGKDIHAMSDDTKSRIFELKKKLLRRAWDGQSNLAVNGAEMILLIQMRLAQCQIPKGLHETIIEESKWFDQDQPRGVRMLNTLARYTQDSSRYSQTTKHMTEH